jgi:hypothetical protein
VPSGNETQILHRPFQWFAVPIHGCAPTAMTRRRRKRLVFLRWTFPGTARDDAIASSKFDVDFWTSISAKVQNLELGTWNLKTLLQNLADRFSSAGRQRETIRTQTRLRINSHSRKHGGGKIRGTYGPTFNVGGGATRHRQRLHECLHRQAWRKNIAANGRDQSPSHRD